jgi:Tfp pilus assembly protein PilF
MSCLLNRLIVVASMVMLASGCQTAINVAAPLSKVERLLDNTSTVPSKTYMLLQDGQFSQAETLLVEALEKSPGNIVDRTNFAMLLARTGRVDQAEQELSRVLALRANYCPAAVQLGQILLTKTKITPAEMSYRGCLLEQPEFAPALISLGILLELYRGQFDEAVQLYEAYQRVSTEPNKRVAIWIAQLNRQLGSSASSQLAEVRHE